MSFPYSVVIPAYNAEATIGEAIESIRRQTILPQEIIVVDDGSTDATVAVVRAMASDATIVRQANCGPGAATTAGFRQVGTSFVATLDADDLWLSQKIERQAARFEAEPDLAGVFGLARLFVDGEPPAADGNGPVRRLWTRTTLLFRIEAAREIGDFIDLPGRLGEVVDWMARSRELGHRHAMVDEVLALRRIREGSLSHRLDRERSRGYLAAVHAAIQRRSSRAGRPADD